MSIATEIERIKAAKESLKSAINSKGGTLTTELIGEFAVAVLDLPDGCEIDLDGVTVTADKMLEGIVAVGADGEKVTGSIQTVAASSDGETVTVPAGFHETLQTFPVSGGPDVSAVTVTASDILDGKIAVGADGQQIVGTIPTVVPENDGNSITIKPGYVASAYLFETYESVFDLVDVTASDVRQNVRAAGKDKVPFLGTMTDWSVQATQAEKGYSVEGEMALLDGGYYPAGFEVTGTHQGGSSMDFYKCASVDTTAKTWDGYKAVLTDGVWDFEETLTTGLTYGTAFAPVVDSIYNQDCSIVVDRLYHGGLPYIPVFSDGLQVVSAAADSGQALSVTGNPGVSGNAVMFPAGSYMQCNTPILNGATEFTYFFIAKTDGSGSDAHLIKDTYDDDYWRVCITYDYNNNNIISAHVRNSTTGETGSRIQIDGNRGLVADTECAIALVYSANGIVLYADGVVIGSTSGGSALLDKDTVLNYGSTYNSRTAVTMRQLHIFDKALTAEEINLLCELYR